MSDCTESAEAALLWDESFLWGLMAYKALKANRLQFELVNSTDIKNGCLDKYGMLFVPGGWASNKIKALGDDGVEEIKRFISGGGNYLGFCGGAGLATLDGIGLLDVKRKPSKERVPSFSGRIELNTSEHPTWKNLNPETSNSKTVFHAWWPSQFIVADEKIRTLATYGNALPDSFSSDLNVGDAGGKWEVLEKLYQIRLDPLRLLNDPALIEGTFGKGKVILSLVHFDTPDDPNGKVVLRNLWEYLGGQKTKERSVPDSRTLQSRVAESGLSPCTGTAYELVDDLESSVAELIDLGLRNFLWFWRNPMLLQWRRGVRGLEYCTLYVLIREIAEILRGRKSGKKNLDAHLERIREMLIPFTYKAMRLLVMERLAMQEGHITYEKCDDPAIREIRNELFSTSKSYSGMFKELIDEVDRLLYSLIV